MLRTVEANIKQININTDLMLAVQYYDGTTARNARHLAILLQEIEEITATHKNTIQAQACESTYA